MKTLIARAAAMLERAAVGALLVLANACSSMQSATIATLQTNELAIISRTEPFTVMLENAPGGAADQSSETTRVTGRVSRATADTIFLSSIVSFAPATRADAGCVTTRSGWLLVDPAAPVDLQARRFDGSRTTSVVGFAVVILVAAVGVLAQAKLGAAAGAPSLPLRQ